MAREEEIILDFNVDVEDSIDSIESLTKASKELREERKKLNLDSAEGQKRLKDINAELDHNTNKIKENVSALEKQKMNIGNYRSALDGVHPVLGKVAGGLEQGASGFKAMAKQALAFIATPIGAVLAALVVVFTLVKSALEKNAGLMDKFENITNAVGVVLNVVVGRVAKLGEALIALATGDFSGALAKTKEAFTGLAEEIGKATTASQLYLDISRDLEDSQRKLGIEIAKSGNRIKLLEQLSKDSSKSFDEREDSLRESLKLQDQIIKKSEELARIDLVNTTKQLALDQQIMQSNDETFEQFVENLLKSEKFLDSSKNAIAEKIKALEDARGGSLAFQQKTENELTALQKQRTEAIEKQNIALEEQAALRRATARAVENVDTSTNNPLIGAFETELKITEDFNERINEANNEAYLEDIRNKRKAEETKLFLQETAQGQALETTERFLSAGAALADRESAAFKAISTAQTLISTFQTAQLAYKSAFLPVATVASPALGAINAAIAVAMGLASVARINGVQFAEGGWTGPGGKWDAVGIVHADEYVTPKRVRHMPQAQPHLAALERMRLKGYADGGLVTNSISGPINQQLEMVNVIKNMPAPVVSVKEITTKTNRVRVKESISKR